MFWFLSFIHQEYAEPLKLSDATDAIFSFKFSKKNVKVVVNIKKYYKCCVVMLLYGRTG